MQGDYYSQNGLGFMYLNGHGKPTNLKKAVEYFDAAASQDFAPSQVSLGKIFLDQGDYPSAIKYFELAARHGNVESYYYLAEIYNSGKGRERSCGMATAYYKIVAERIEAIHSPFEWANRAYAEGDVESALVGYMMAAEQGYESAQQNVAFILDDQKSRLPLFDLLNLIKTKTLGLVPTASSAPAQGQGEGKKSEVARVEQATHRNRELALIYYTRSAKQATIDSLVKMGDYYLSGIGTELDHEKAAACYQAASEFQQSAQALWNLGWMHENGVGVEQDFHLAKRFYDLALETNPSEAYLPVVMSLAKLRVRGWWNRISGGGVNDIGPEVGYDGAQGTGKKEKKKWSLKEFLKKWNEEVDAVHRAQEEAVRMAEEAERQGVEEGVFVGQENAGYDDENGGLEAEDVDEEFMESLLIIVLATVVMLLIWYRQQRILRERREIERQAGGAGAVEVGEVFPGPEGVMFGAPPLP